LVVLRVLTAVLALAAWRGPWAPSDRAFPLKMTALLIATVLVSYHSHVYGPIPTAVPLAATLAGGLVGWPTRLLLLATILLPAVGFTLLRLPAAPIALLLVCLGALLFEDRRLRREALLSGVTAASDVYEHQLRQPVVSK
jgi:hypothetical protein